MEKNFLKRFSNKILWNKMKTENMNSYKKLQQTENHFMLRKRTKS